MSYWTIWNQTLCYDTSSKTGVSCEKLGLLSSRSWSQWGVILKNDCLFHIFWTADLSATKLAMVMHHQGLQCCTKGQSEGSNPLSLSILSLLNHSPGLSATLYLNALAWIAHLCAQIFQLPYAFGTSKHTTGSAERFWTGQNKTISKFRQSCLLLSNRQSVSLCCAKIVKR